MIYALGRLDLAVDATLSIGSVCWPGALGQSSLGFLKEGHVDLVNLPSSLE